MGAIKQSEFEIEQRMRTYNEILSREACAFAKLCAICTKPIILQKDGVIMQCDQCDQCVYKKSFRNVWKMQDNYLNWTTIKLF